MKQPCVVSSMMTSIFQSQESSWLPSPLPNPSTPCFGGINKAGIQEQICLHTGPIMFGSRDRTTSKE